MGQLSYAGSFLRSQRIFKASLSILSEASEDTILNPSSRSMTESTLQKSKQLAFAFVHRKFAFLTQFHKLHPILGGICSYVEGPPKTFCNSKSDPVLQCKASIP